MKLIKKLILTTPIFLSLQALAMELPDLSLAVVEIDLGELSDEAKDQLIGLGDLIDDAMFKSVKRNGYLYRKYGNTQNSNADEQEYKEFLFLRDHVNKVAGKLLASKDSVHVAGELIKLQLFNSGVIKRKTEEDLGLKYKGIKENSELQSELNIWRRTFATALAKFLVKIQDNDDKYIFVLKASMSRSFHGSIGYPGDTTIFDFNCLGMRQKMGVSNFALSDPTNPSSQEKTTIFQEIIKTIEIYEQFKEIDVTLFSDEQLLNLKYNKENFTQFKYRAMSARRIANNLLNAEPSEKNALQIRKLRTYNSELLGSETIKRLEDRYHQVSQNPLSNFDKSLKAMIAKLSNEMFVEIDRDLAMIKRARKVAELFINYNFAHMNEATKNGFRKYYPEVVARLEKTERNRPQEIAIAPKQLEIKEGMLLQNKFHTLIKEAEAEANGFLTQKGIKIPPFFSLTKPDKINSQFNFIIIKNYTIGNQNLRIKRGLWLLPRESYDFAKINDLRNIYEKAILNTAETLEHSGRCMLTYTIFNKKGEAVALLKFYQYNDDEPAGEYRNDPGL